jgi:hypothetical protein
MPIFNNCSAKFIFIALYLSVSGLYGQNYTFRTYLNDNEITGTIKQHFTTDTIRKYIGHFHDRLGYQYYLYQSALKYSESKTASLSYLDSAFARGLDTICIPPLIKQMFGQGVINTSRSVHFLTAYDIKLKRQLDSLKKEDQRYRQLAYKKGQRKPVTDSIMALWKLSDSSNVVFLKTLIKKDGYPSARKIGYNFCAFGNNTDPELIIQHLGTKERDFQIEILKKVVELCLKNEENWDKISALQFNLHFRFCDSYSEFTFLHFNDHKLDNDNSLFSIMEMVKFLRTPFKNIYIKCSSERTFTELKAAMFEINESLPLPPNMEDFAKVGLPIQKKITQDQFVFVMDTSLPNDKIHYKISYK